MKRFHKLVIAGGSGFLGQSLVDYFGPMCDELVILSRGGQKQIGTVRHVAWDGKTAGSWVQELERADALINLCGKSVDCRYTATNKALIFSSRLEPTTALGQAILTLKTPPKVWIQAASATIYRHSEKNDLAMTEADGEIGHGFSVEVCKAWEKTFFQFTLPSTRQVNLRIGMVLGCTGGVFPTLCKLTRLGLGGRMGNGRQLISWIHVNDFCRMVEWSIAHTEVAGSYNCTAPEPVSNREFMKLLRKELAVRIGIPATAWMLEFGAFFIRTEPELVLKSRHVIPEKAMKQGFLFEYTDATSCVHQLVNTF